MLLHYVNNADNYAAIVNIFKKEGSLQESRAGCYFV
jgi:hypothetical protein